MTVSIPANTTAVVRLPAADPATVTESGKPASAAEGVKFLGSEAGESAFEIGAGRYQFVMPWTGKVRQVRAMRLDGIANR